MADPGSNRADAGPADRDRLVQEGLEHLQRAARESIAAMRSMLDLAGELVEDPRTVETVVATIGSLAQAVVRSGSGLGAGRWRDSATAAANRCDDEGDEGGGVQRIPVS